MSVDRRRRVGLALVRAPSPRRIGIAIRSVRDAWLDHVFDRSSPISPLAPDVLARIYASEVVMPPRNLLMRPGAQTIEGLFFISSLAKALEAKELFEIGTFTGLTTWCLARNLPDAVVHTLDLPPDQTPQLELEPSDLGNRRDIPRRTFEDLPAPGRVVQHWGDSAKFDFGPFQSACDLVYVDGAHSEPYVESDSANALRMVSSRGAVVWDDYWRHVGGVRRVLDRLEVKMFRVPSTRLVVYVSPPAARALGVEAPRAR